MSRIDRTAPVYSIGVVEKLTGLTGRQIRYYEQHGLIRPQRTKGKQRLYSPADVDRLLQIKELLNQGLSLQGIKGWLDGHAAGSGPAGAKPPPRHEVPLPPVEGVPQLDHDLIVSQLAAGRKLTSIFPVDNQAELIRRLTAPGFSRPGSEHASEEANMD